MCVIKMFQLVSVPVYILHGVVLTWTVLLVGFEGFFIFGYIFEELNNTFSVLKLLAFMNFSMLNPIKVFLKQRQNRTGSRKWFHFKA